MKRTGFARQRIVVGDKIKTRGFHSMIFGYEISYTHFEEHIGIAWRRRLIVGSRIWYLTEGWRVYAKSKGGKLKWVRK